MQKHRFWYYVRGFGGLPLYYYEVGWADRRGKWHPVVISGTCFRTMNDCQTEAIRIRNSVENAYGKREKGKVYRRLGGAA